MASERAILLTEMVLGVFVEPGAHLSEALVFLQPLFLPVYPALIPPSPRTT